jgi:hypothetical protein
MLGVCGMVRNGGTGPLRDEHDTMNRGRRVNNWALWVGFVRTTIFTGRREYSARRKNFHASLAQKRLGTATNMWHYGTATCIAP